MARPGPGELAGWLAEHASGPGRVGVAVTGMWGRGAGDVTGMALAAREGAGAFVDPVELVTEDERALAEWLADPKRPKAIHDAKGPMLAFAARGLELAGVTNDTALAAYLALPGQRSFDLGDLVLRYLHRELRKEADDSGQLTIDGSGEQEAAYDLVVRARAVVDLAEALDADLERRGATRLLREVELPLVEVLAGMERVGIALDIDYLAALSANFGAEVKAMEEAAWAAIGREFNLGSPKQIQQILFEELALPKTRRTKTGYTTDSEALTTLLEQTAHPVLEHLLRHREVAKLKSIVDSLIPMADEDRRIHTTFGQMIAATGRLSSADPNLQNIPIRTAEGRQIREAFVVGAGYDCLLTADYSQIELRIMAHLSEDAALIEAFGSGEDFHTITASRVFGVPSEQIDTPSCGAGQGDELRVGLRPVGVRAGPAVRITPAEARALHGGVLRAVRRGPRLPAGRRGQARHDGYTETILGRRRYLPDLTSDNRQRREMAERMALNAPIQGVGRRHHQGGDVGGGPGDPRGRAAVADAAAGPRRAGLEVAPGELAERRALVRARMAGAFELRVPLEVSMGTGRTWQEAGH